MLAVKREREFEVSSALIENFATFTLLTKQVSINHDWKTILQFKYTDWIKTCVNKIQMLFSEPMKSLQHVTVPIYLSRTSLI